MVRLLSSWKHYKCLWATIIIPQRDLSLLSATHLPSPSSSQILSSMQKWETNLNFTVDLTSCHSSVSKTLRFSQCLSHCQSAQNLLHHWYHTPGNCLSLPISSSNMLEELQLYRNNCAHLVVLPDGVLFLDRSPFSYYKPGILQAITCQLALLGLGLENWPRNYHPILTHTFITFINRTYCYWKSNSTPSIQQLINILNQHLPLELIFAKWHMTMHKVMKDWSPWLNDPRSHMMLNIINPPLITTVHIQSYQTSVPVKSNKISYCSHLVYNL